MYSCRAASTAFFQSTSPYPFCKTGIISPQDVLGTLRHNGMTFRGFTVLPCRARQISASRTALAVSDDIHSGRNPDSSMAMACP